jgi:integrase
MLNDWRPDISNPVIALSLLPRHAPYFKIIEYCRHIGLHVTCKNSSFWVARIRKKDGRYKQKRICLAYQAGNEVVSFNDALAKATEWFTQPDTMKMSSQSYPLGSKRHLNICPMGTEYTVGHALRDYLDWKLVAATRSHFETLVSMCNYHLVPRISHIPLQRFNGKDFQILLRDVLETSPKKGRNSREFRTNITSLSQEQLRKRKKTCNSLISILRGAFEIAWEHGHIENDRPMRCLRRLPNIDRPRVIFLSRRECRVLLSECHPDLKPLILAALYTGCRANELVAMQVSDFNLDTKSVYVSNPKGQRTRHILMPEEAVCFFEGIVKDRSPSDRMFRKRNGRAWGNEYRAYFKAIQLNPKLPSRLTFHGLRHTYASQLVQNGASLMFIAAQLGHANTQTISSTYGHLCSTSGANEIDRCFSPILSKQDQFSTVVNVTSETKENTQTKYLNRYSHNTSWPRSNFSKFSGPLLAEIKPQRA